MLSWCLNMFVPFISEVISSAANPTVGPAEGLTEAIQLLSCKSVFSVPFSTPELIPTSSSGQTSWTESHEDRMHRRMYGGPSSQR